MRAVDLFAGAGGFTCGALAAGLDVVACADHWRAAIDIHAANHPGVEHVCGNLLELDMRRLPRHEVLLASPACQLANAMPPALAESICRQALEAA